MKQKSQITLIREAVRMLNNHPGLTKRWPFQINLRRLNMRNWWRHCVLGQLFGNYAAGKEALGISNRASPHSHGFSSWMSTELWKTKIRQLRVSYQKALGRKRRRR